MCFQHVDWKCLLGFPFQHRKISLEIDGLSIRDRNISKTPAQHKC